MKGGAVPDQLPVRRVGAEVVDAMRGGGAMVLSAATGSGKTTQVPQMLLEGGCIQGQIVVLEPRRLAARMTAQRVAQEMGSPLGGLVGFQTRFERAVSAQTRIRFVTDGVFLRQALGNPRMEGIGAVLLDEFHERSLNADMALGIVLRARAGRKALTRGSHGALALGIMSATLDVAAVAEATGATAISAEGRAFPVAVRYEPGDAGAPIWERAADAVAKAMLEQPEGDALVFMPGVLEIDRTVEAVRARCSFGRTDGRAGNRVGNRTGGGGAEPVDVAALHGRMPAEVQDAAVAPARDGRRKVIVATNVAETSITIPGVRIVVDAGTARIFRVDPRRGLNALREEPISRASADQRAGRAGRTAPGLCIRLWDERQHAQRPAAEEPEVLRVDLSEAMLMLGGAEACAQFRWLDAPRAESLERARSALTTIGALDGRGARTELGERLVRIPAHPRLARALAAAAESERSAPGVLARVARWCAIAAERDVVQGVRASGLVRLTPDGEPPSDIAAREELLLRVQRSGFRAERHEGVDANATACRAVAAAAQELERAASRLAELAPPVPERAPPASAAPSFELASRALLAGFPDHIAWRLDAQRPHCLMSGRRKVSIDRDSIQRGAGLVLALEIREGGRGDQTHQSLALVTPLETEWARHELPGRFTTRVETRFCAELGAPAEFEEELLDGNPISQVVRPLRGAAAVQAAHGELAARIASGELKPASWNEQVKQWIARVRCAAEWFPERAIIRYDHEDMQVLADEIAQGCQRASQLDDRPVLDLVRNALSWEEQQWVERVAPSAIALPSGFRMKLEYQQGKPPTGRAKIQDFYDVKGHPAVAMGRVKVRLELLGPNFRPVQVTDDLPGFWVRLYPEVKKELKRRYPRHEWR